MSYGIAKNGFSFSRLRDQKKLYILPEIIKNKGFALNLSHEGLKEQSKTRYYLTGFHNLWCNSYMVNIKNLAM